MNLTTLRRLLLLILLGLLLAIPVGATDVAIAAFKIKGFSPANLGQPINVSAASLKSAHPRRENAMTVFKNSLLARAIASKLTSSMQAISCKLQLFRRKNCMSSACSN